MTTKTKKIYLRRRDVEEKLGITEWVFRKWLEEGVLQPYGLTRKYGRGVRIVPWAELKPDERMKQRRLYRAVDLDELLGDVG